MYSLVVITHDDEMAGLTKVCGSSNFNNITRSSLPYCSRADLGAPSQSRLLAFWSLGPILSNFEPLLGTLLLLTFRRLPDVRSR